MAYGRVQSDACRNAPRPAAVRDLQQFVLRGNVVDLAVGIVIGVAFGAVVMSLVTC